MDVEDETSTINEKTLKKLDKYRVNLEYCIKLPVISAITTPLKFDKKIIFNKSATLTFSPLIVSYPLFKGRERLSSIMTKIENNEILTNVEAMNLVMIPRMFTKNQDLVLEKVCNLLPKANIGDEDFKFELVFEMRCVIHKYAKTLEDILRLEKVIGLKKAMTALDYKKQEFKDKCRAECIEEGIEQGIEQGIARGEFNMALKIRDFFGISRALEISNFSREELESGKLNR